MTSIAPHVTCVFLTLLALAASGLYGMHLLPAIFLAPLSFFSGTSLRRETTTTELHGPAGLLVQQLENVDVVHEPEKSLALHTAIGHMLRASQAPTATVVHHFEAAREAAKRGNDPDALLAAHVNVAEAYIEDRRPLDAHHELAVATGVPANHFAENSVKLNRLRGLAQFQLGHRESAWQYLQEAQKSAEKPEDVVRIACDSSQILRCLGHVKDNLRLLRQALVVLGSARHRSPDSGTPVELYTSLAAEVHLRLAQALHSDMDALTAEVHYKKALHFEQKMLSVKHHRILAIKQGLADLQKRIFVPQVSCPTSRKAPWEAVGKQVDVRTDTTFIEKITALQANEQYDKAESELFSILKTHPRPYHGLASAAVLNMLGETYKMQTVDEMVETGKAQQSFKEAAKHFRQALQAALAADGAASEEAQAAYAGLNDVASELSDAKDQQVAAAALHRYSEDAKKLGILVSDVDAPVVDVDTSGSLEPDAKLGFLHE